MITGDKPLDGMADLEVVLLNCNEFRFIPSARTSRWALAHGFVRTDASAFRLINKTQHLLNNKGVHSMSMS